MEVASLPKMMKPDIGGKAMSKHPSDLPGWLGTARVERSVEEPGRPCGVVAKAANARREDITVAAAQQGVGEAQSSEEAGQRPWSQGALLKTSICKRRRKPLG
jgi:hypothetical protein